ncbi:hypothetical protein HRbin30_03061 [bacterium HR30]|nr:hypothetical protein HRbin30_03061 [bacterium HR30]
MFVTVRSPAPSEVTVQHGFTASHKINCLGRRAALGTTERARPKSITDETGHRAKPRQTRR